MRGEKLTKGNPKKRYHNRKPPVRRKRLELSRRPTQNEVPHEGASVGSVSKVVVEDASIGDGDDGDDGDSCFGACLATNKDYDGPVDCSLEGPGDVPIVDCTSLQREQTQSSSCNGDAASTHTSTERESGPTLAGSELPQRPTRVMSFSKTLRILQPDAVSP